MLTSRQPLSGDQIVYETMPCRSDLINYDVAESFVMGLHNESLELAQATRRTFAEKAIFFLCLKFTLPSLKS